MPLGSLFSDVVGGIGRAMGDVATLGMSENWRNQNQAIAQAIQGGNNNPGTVVNNLTSLGDPQATAMAMKIMENQPAFNPLTPKDAAAYGAQMYAANPLMNSPPDLGALSQGIMPGQQAPQGAPATAPQGAPPPPPSAPVGPQPMAQPQTQQQTMAALMQSDLSGDDFLAALAKVNPGIAGTVKQMISGDKKMSGMGANSPQMLVLNHLANKADPDYSDQRYETKQAFLPQGKNGQTIASINKVINHTASWLDSMSQLGNSDNAYLGHVMNYGKNLVSEAGNAPVLKAAQTNAAAAGTEIAKALRGVGAINEQEQQEWQKTLSTADTPAEQKAVANKVFELLQGQIEPLQQELQRGMGKKANIGQFLNPETQAAMQRIQAIGENGNSPAKAAVPQALQPPAIQGAQASKTIGGKTYHLVNGQWMQ